MIKTRLEQYIKVLLQVNETYRDVLGLEETDSLYSAKWLEDTCDDILKILNDEESEED